MAAIHLRPRVRAAATLVATLAAATTCGVFAAGTSGAASRPDPAARHTLTPVAALGRRLFFDPALSASGKLACASCHDPAHAYAPPNSRAVQLGGADLRREGTRAVPSLRYVLRATPLWRAPYPASPVERLLEGGASPVGGLGWDGRFATLHEQARFPLLAANEMANASPAAVAATLARASYAREFRRIFGVRSFADPVKAFDQATLALERFELEDPSFHPFSSRFDEFLDGRAQLTGPELHGLALFSDPARGNCTSCHPLAVGADGSHPLLTDFQFEALGVPRNPEIAANADPAYFDEGLCGPLRTDQRQTPAYCGQFKTPGLRNVATRGAFFHNGRFHSLREVLRFYVQRDTDSAKWYPPDEYGRPQQFDDLPAELRVNVDVVDEPLTRRTGDAPAWTETEIDDVLAFLQTLSDRDAQIALPP